MEIKEYNNPEFTPIKDRARKKQLIDFRNLSWGKICPTDCDGAVDFQEDNIAFFFELKLHYPTLPVGQRLNYENSADCIQARGMNCVVMVGVHNVEDPEEDVDAGNVPAHSYYYKNKWHKCKENEYSMRELTDLFREQSRTHGYLSLV